MNGWSFESPTHRLVAREVLVQLRYLHGAALLLRHPLYDGHASTNRPPRAEPRDVSQVRGEIIHKLRKMRHSLAARSNSETVDRLAACIRTPPRRSDTPLGD